MLYFTTSVSSGQNDQLWVLDDRDTDPLLIHQSSIIYLNYPVGRQLYFSSFSTTGISGLWLTDGTQTGTTFLLELANNLAVAERIHMMADLNGTSFFVKASIIGVGVRNTAYELWRSDGTTAGTQLLKTIVDVEELLQNSTTQTIDLVVAGGKVFCVTLIEINDTPGTLELWVSDGTVEGTYVVEQLTPQAPFISDNPDLLPEMASGGTQLLFTTYSEVHGQELWASDGTAVGTQLFQDINPGSDSADPSQFTIAGPYRFFVADDGQRGQELWAIPFRAAPTITLDPITFRASDNIMLNAFINANNAETTVTFQITTTSGDYTNPLVIPATVNGISGTTDTKVQADISNDLLLNTTYFYRIVATNSEGTTISAERLFTTTPYRSFLPFIVRGTN